MKVSFSSQNEKNKVWYQNEISINLKDQSLLTEKDGVQTIFFG
jgi:hypothetical protein